MKLQDRNFLEFQLEETDSFEPKISCATSKAIYKNGAQGSDSDYGSDPRQIFVPVYDTRIN